jgi:hypothetical protein
VTLALLAAPDNRSCNQGWKFFCHFFTGYRLDACNCN